MTYAGDRDMARRYRPARVVTGRSEWTQWDWEGVCVWRVWWEKTPPMVLPVHVRHLSKPDRERAAAHLMYAFGGHGHGRSHDWCYRALFVGLEDRL